jgi:TonB family protein
MARRTASAVLLFFALVPGLTRAFGQAAGRGFPQTNQVAAAAVNPMLPKNLKELMVLGWRVNGVEGVDKPWHLKATYQTFDADGQPKETGTFEEWWNGSEKSKRSFTSAGFDQTRDRDGNKISVAGDPLVPFQDRVAVDFLLRPLAGKAELEYLFFTSAEKNIGAVTLHCVLPSGVAPQLMASEDVAGNPMLALRESFRGWGVPTTCFNPDSAIARVELFDNGISSLFDGVVDLDGQYVAKDIWIRNGSVPIEHLAVTTLEVPAKLDESTFAVPAAARAEGKYSGGRRISGKPTTYPRLAKTQKTEGLVMIRAKITKTGDIADLEVISGPKELRAGALETVKTWKYEPYRLNGQPVEMSTVVSVIYRLGR